MDRELAFLRTHQPSFAPLRVATRILAGTALARMALQEEHIQSESQVLHQTLYIAAALRPWLVTRLQTEADQNRCWTST